MIIRAPENAVAISRILVDRQRLPLSAQIEHLQDVVEVLFAAR
jgi:hypothetical protein